MTGTASPRGFTLIELLLLVAVIAITLPMAGAVFQERLAEYRSASAMAHVRTVFAVAREQAVMTGKTVTVCALTASGRCSRDWQHPGTIAAFVDTNGDHRYASGDRLIRQIQWPLKTGELSWRASLARNYIDFESNGGTWQNGTLYYCPESRDARAARALVLSHSGRSYLPGDSNDDGIREDRLGRNLRC